MQWPMAIAMAMAISMVMAMVVSSNWKPPWMPPSPDEAVTKIGDFMFIILKITYTWDVLQVQDWMVGC